MKILTLLLLSLSAPLSTWAAEFSQVEVFRSGQDGYHTYRIPALIVTKQGTLLAFCEGRHSGGGDSGDIDLLLKRSRDGGRTWTLGGSASDRTNESAVVELQDHSLMLNMRSYHGKNRRAVATSRDRGRTWSGLTIAEALIEPVCQASLISLGKGRLLFSNPADTKRVRMTVKLSPDDGQSWPVARVVHEGLAAYSSLTSLKDGRIGLLYERGERRAYDVITFARFDRRWLESSTK